MDTTRRGGVELVKVWAIELFSGASLLYVRTLHEATEMMLNETSDDDYEVGDEIKITVCEMSQTEYDDLPEWDGP